MTISTICRECGTPIEADRTRILAGTWQTCDACRPQRSDHPTIRPMAGQCQRCGRPLLNRDRTLCLQCHGFTVS